MHLRMDQLDWNQLKAFLETAETGSLSAAARKLGLTQPTLSRQVAAIERSMGVTLFERVGKAMALTPTGLDLLEHARAMGTAAEALGLAATGRSQAVGGVVSVSATDAVAAHLLPPLLRRLREQEPGITIEVIPSNALSDLLRREADIAIRHVKPDQPDLIARFIREATANFYASEDWVKTHGHPRHSEDATHLPFVGSDRTGQYLGYLRAHGHRARARRRAGGALPDLAGHPPRTAHLATDAGGVRGAGSGLGLIQRNASKCTDENNTDTCRRC
jgi:DNA-binding transcriptional LysR family regulator